MSRVVTYDLPIDYCWHSWSKTGLEEPRRQADWLESDDYYFSGKLTVPPIPPVIEQDVAEGAEQGKAEEKARSCNMRDKYMENDMGESAVVLNDATSHDDKVSLTPSTSDIQRKKATLLNDTVACPGYGTNPVVECDTSYEEGGRGIAVHGRKSVCSSVVYASSPDVEIG